MAWKQRGKMVKHGKSSTAKWPKELKQQMVQAVCRKKPTHSCHNRHQMMETNSGMTFSTISRKTLGNLGTGWEASANLTVNNDTYVSNIVRNLLRADSLRGFANNPQICSSSHILTQHEIIQTKAQKTALPVLLALPRLPLQPLISGLCIRLSSLRKGVEISESQRFDIPNDHKDLRHLPKRPAFRFWTLPGVV